MIRIFLVFCAMAIITSALVGCGGEPDTSPKPQSSHEIDYDTPVSGDAFIDCSISDAVILNPLLASDHPSLSITSMIFNSLIRYSPNYELEGELAKNFEISTNTLVQYIHLKNIEEASFDANLLMEKIKNVDVDVDNELLSNIDNYKVITPQGSDFANCLRIEFKQPPSDDDKETISQLIPDDSLRLISPQTALSFRLRDDVLWHDGKPFTADDVLFTWSIIQNPEVSVTGRSRYYLVDEVLKITPYQIRITYREPFAPAISSWGGSILPKHLLEGEDINTADFNRAPIGTGPYRFVDWQPDQRIVLESNPDYFEGAPFISRYIYMIVPDKSIQMVKLMSEEIDYMSLTPDQYDKTASTEEFKSRFHIFNYPDNSGYTYMGYNHSNELFSDPRVRRAMTQAIDRKTLIDGVLRGHGHEISGPFPKASWACDHNIKPWSFNPEESKRLLSDAGWTEKDEDGILVKNIDGQKKRFSFNLTTNNGDEIRKLSCRLIAQQLKDVGIEAKVEFMEWNRFLEEIDFMRYDAVVLGWGLTKDPDQYGIWHSSQVPDMNSGKTGNNFINYVNPEIDNLLESGRTTMVQEQRQKIYHQIHAIMHQEQPYTFLFAENSIVAVHSRIHGIELKPTGIWHNYIKWYVPAPIQKYK